MVASPGSVTVVLVPRSSRMVLVVAFGSQLPLSAAPPKAGAAGSVRPGGIGEGAAPENGSAVLPLNGTAALALDAGHATTAPRRRPVMLPKGPVLMVPSATGDLTV